jgi:peptidoglycan lytic transglycosylase
MSRRLACPVVLAALWLLAACASHHPPPSAGSGGNGLYKVGQPYQIEGTWYYPAEDFSYDETGIASWYGADFHGKNTANGEVFDFNELTGAHRTLPMPSVVQVTNLDNGRSIKLRVNDRGPYARGRIIDVSRRAAQLLGFEVSGTAKVRVKILVPETIQVASLARRNGSDDKPETLPAAPVAAVTAQELLSPPPNPRMVANAVRPVPAAEPVALAPATALQIFIQVGAFAMADNAIKVKNRLDRLGAVKVQGVKVKGVEVYRVRLGPIASVDEADRLLDRVVATGLAEARIVVE